LGEGSKKEDRIDMMIPDSLAKRIISIADELKSLMEPKEEVENKYEKKKVNGMPYSKACETIVDYLNKQTNRDFRHSTQKTRDLIYARFNDGFTLKDFKVVMDNKIKDWLGDPDYEKYLRPATLFGNKFEGYLNEKIVTAKERPEDVIKRKNFYSE
jgi:uncharacterized phage protein (TIGR02220 family)